MSEYIEEDVFKSLDDESKWDYIKHLIKQMENLKVMAQKNCEECEKYHLTSHDVNVDLLFEDWRECKDHCHECSIKDQVFMCQLQFDLMNHLANSIIQLQNKLNGFVRVLLSKEEKGRLLLERFEKMMEQEEEKSSSMIS